MRGAAWILWLAAGAACAPNAVAPDDVDASTQPCVPGERRCDGETVLVCNDDATGYVAQRECDPLQGLTCDAAGAHPCAGSCAPERLGRSYIGCEYFPTVTANMVDGAFTFAVAVSNTTEQSASVHIEGGALPSPRVLDVLPGAVEVVELPWVEALKACTSFGEVECGAPQRGSARAAGGAYHLRSTKPVTVYQFSPLRYRLGEQYSNSNDASLLLPANALGTDYTVASWPAWYMNASGGMAPGLLGISATEDNTTVEIAVTAETSAAPGLPALEPGEPRQLSLDAGDVLQLLATSGDLTGSMIAADRPVQVIAGHYCTEIPHGAYACDHLEDAMFPLRALGGEYAVAAPALPTGGSAKARVIRLVATADDTSVSFDPPIRDPLQLARGDVVQLDSIDDSVVITANEKIVVAEYMLGESAGGAAGDPSLALAVPTAQFRRAYQFHAPPSYDVSFVNVIAPLGAEVSLDADPPITDFMPIGDSGFGLVRVRVEPGSAGTHVIKGSMPFGITVYGYGAYTTYWYPGGLDLEPVIVN